MIFGHVYDTLWRPTDSEVITKDSVRLRDITQIAWDRFKIIASIVGDAQARIIATLFYFTILLPFGLLSHFFSDPLQQRSKSPGWLERPTLPNDLETAKQQG
jgi:hypothetical protein